LSALSAAVKAHSHTARQRALTCVARDAEIKTGLTSASFSTHHDACRRVLDVNAPLGFMHQPTTEIARQYFHTQNTIGVASMRQHLLFLGTLK